jgi:hypothetical protein
VGGRGSAGIQTKQPEIQATKMVTYTFAEKTYFLGRKEGGKEGMREEGRKGGKRKEKYSESGNADEGTRPSEC